MAYPCVKRGTVHDKQRTGNRFLHGGVCPSQLRFSDGAYYFKDTTVKESDFEMIDDTIANPFEQIDLPLS